LKNFSNYFRNDTRCHKNCENVFTVCENIKNSKGKVFYVGVQRNKIFLLNNFLTSITFYLLTVYAKTLKVQVENTDKIQKHLENNGRIVFACWHQRLFGGFFVPKIFRWSPYIMISQSRDGDFISKVVRHIGWIPVRGSSSRGGKQALRALIDGIQKQRIGGHIVDGPTGPPYVVKPGLVVLAGQANACICVGIVSYEKFWKAKSWDQFMIPKPFSKVLIRFGTIFQVHGPLNHEQFESFCKQIEDTMLKEYAAADHSWNK